MNNSTGSLSTLRGDLNVIVEEAYSADIFFIAQQIMPVLPVAIKSGQYPKLTKTLTGLLDTGGDVRAPKASYPRVSRQWTSDTYDCLDRGLEELVDDAEAKDFGRFADPMGTAARLTLRNLMINYEARVASAIMDNGVFTATAAVVSYTETNIATINFVKDIGLAIERLNAKGVIPNTIVMSSTVLNQLKRSTLLLNAARGTRPTNADVVITSDTIKALVVDQGINNVFIGRTRYNSAKAGQTAVLTQCWPNTYIWVGEVQGGSPNAGGAGRTFVWNEEGGLFVTETYRSDSHRSTVVRVRQNTAEKIIDSAAGELITTSYSAS